MKLSGRSLVLAAVGVPLLVYVLAPLEKLTHGQVGFSLQKNVSTCPQALMTTGLEKTGSEVNNSTSLPITTHQVQSTN